MRVWRSELSRRNLTPLQLSSIVSTVFWSFVLHLFHFPFLEYSCFESGIDDVINIVIGIHPNKTPALLVSGEVNLMFPAH